MDSVTSTKVTMLLVLLTMTLLSSPVSCYSLMADEERKNLLTDHELDATPVNHNRRDSESFTKWKESNLRGLKRKKKKCKASKKGKAKGKKNKVPKRCKGIETPNYLPEKPLVGPSPSMDQQAVLRCFTALQLAEYNTFNIDAYSNWYNESSIMVVGDTGFFLGGEGIKEYIKFLTQGEDHVFSGYDVDQTTLGVLPIKAEGNECIVTTYAKTSIFSNYIENPIDFLGAQRASFTILDDINNPYPSRILVSRTDVYTPPGLLAYTLTGTKTEEFATKLCGIMHTSCPSTFEENCYTEETIDDCVADLLSLPLANEDGKLDDKSFGCRVLHAFFVSTNNNHCPHISFLPKYDVNCLVKCQTSKGITNEDLFHPFELGTFAQAAASLGFGPEQWNVRE